MNANVITSHREVVVSGPAVLQTPTGPLYVYGDVP
jgi:hypothetical protein